MLDEADGGIGISKKILQPALALDQRLALQIGSVGMQQIEGEEDEVFRLLFRQRCLQRGKIRHAMLVERHDLAIDDRIGQAR